MTNFQQSLHILTEKWRLTGKRTRVIAAQTTNVVARGHMNGLSDGLDLAADDVQKLLEKPDRPTH